MKLPPVLPAPPTLPTHALQDEAHQLVNPLILDFVQRHTLASEGHQQDAQHTRSQVDGAEAAVGTSS